MKSKSIYMLTKHYKKCSALLILILYFNFSFSKTIFKIIMPENNNYTVKFLAYKTQKVLDSFKITESNSSTHALNKYFNSKTNILIININFIKDKRTFNIFMSSPLIYDSFNCLKFNNIENINDCEYSGNSKLTIFNNFYRKGLVDNFDLMIKPNNKIDSFKLVEARNILFKETMLNFNLNQKVWNLLILEALGYIHQNQKKYKIFDSLYILNESFCSYKTKDFAILNYKELFCVKNINYQGIDSLNTFYAQSKSLKYNEIKVAKNGLIILDFWATWCKPCLKELNYYDTLIRNIKKDYSFIFVSIDTDNKKWFKFYSNHSFLKNFDNYLDSKNYSGDKFNFTTIPFNLIYYNGNLIARNIHGKELEDLILKY